ncbi:MAG: MoaD/ThiS family protein, partial [Pseudomonadota bacterium]|nr:MoaD/ThiS family protein [Pseudomonadota bacterium]
MQTIEIKIEAFGAIERLLPKALAFEFAADQQVLDVFSHIVGFYRDAA